MSPVGAAGERFAPRPSHALAGPIAVSQSGDPALAPLVTLHDIELCRIGSWSASTGRADVDAAMLASIVAASADPEVDHAPAHFGHYDARFPALTDGEPAVGWVENVRAREGTLVGDLTRVPAKLADVIRSAYRRRSVELAENVRTPSGRVYRHALIGLGLLGVAQPAVKGLADVVARYSTGTSSTATQLLTLQLEGMPGPAPLPSAVPAGHDVAQHTPPPTGGAPVPTSPFTDERLRELLGYQADVDVSALQAQIAAQQPAAPAAPAAPVLPGAPATPAPVAQAPAAVAPLTANGQPVAPAAPAAPVAPAAPQQPAAAAPAAPLAPVLPFPVPAQQPAAAAPAPAAPAQTPAVAAAAAPVYFPPAVAPTPGTVTLSAGQWEQLQTFLSAETSRRRSDIADQAVATNRISLSEKPAWLAALERDEAGTYQLLQAIPPSNRIPMGEIGGAGVALSATTARTSAQDAAFASFEDSLGLAISHPAPAAQPAQIGA